MAGCECNKCGKIFEMSNGSFKSGHDGELAYSFFVCPHCGAKYPVSVTDEALRKAIAEVPPLSEVAKRMRLQGRFDNKLAAEIEQKINANKKRCDELIAEHWERLAGAAEK